MGIREQLEKHPRLTTGVTIGVIIVVLALIFWPSDGNGAGAYPRTLFFTDDDGQTWFADDANKVPPFERNGKQAVRAYVYRCGGKTFVNHMERFTADAKKKLEQISGNDLIAKLDPSVSGIPINSKEVKAPGRGIWVNIADRNAVEVMRPKCDNLSDLERLTP
jgi:hypothetical protein